MQNRINGAVEYIKARCEGAQVGLVLGSGLGDYADSLYNKQIIDYKDIPGFPVSPTRAIRTRRSSSPYAL